MILTDEMIIERVTKRIYEANPELLERYGDRGKEKCREDNNHHLKQLSAAFTVNSEAMFIDYAHWLNGILVRHGMETKHLTENFLFLEEAMKEDSSTRADVYRAYLQAARSSLDKSF
ncbi:hypothetical protein [Alkalicoccus luteus]|uniref:hypothetical protein n=1 Tax=Alkalicoccus luteus TaxID=1237094 RepID=UPI001FE441E0|nr:hypothetical protein [Alkalicoccus luteus]